MKFMNNCIGSVHRCVCLRINDIANTLYLEEIKQINKGKGTQRDNKLLVIFIERA